MLCAALWSLACAAESPALVETSRSRVPVEAAQPQARATSADDVARPVQALAKSVDVTILSTSKAGIGEGEWGFSALVEVDGMRILFDTGAKRETVLHNAKAARVDLGGVSSVVLSHHHDDHVGGLMRLRNSVASTAPDALKTVHVARGMFESRHVGGKRREVNEMLELRQAFEASGGVVLVHDEPSQIAPGVWVTGPVPRLHPEHNWGGARQVRGPTGWVEDQLHESQALVIDTEAGLLVVSGCGHAGIVNIATHARNTIREAPIHALGGFHLHRADSEHLAWTMEQLRALGLESFYGAHCTGKAAVREAAKHLPADQVAEVAVGWTLHL